MDIITVVGPNGKLNSSPFHIRFGTLQILNTKEKIVEVFVNGKKKELTLKLSSSGDAYFPYTAEDDNSDSEIESPVKKHSAPNSPKTSMLNIEEEIQEMEILNEPSANYPNSRDLIEEDLQNIERCVNLDSISLKQELNEVVKIEIKKDNITTKRRESLSKARTFVPNSNQLKLLNLQEGRNEISFICHSRLSGKQVLTSEIYLWDYRDQIIISDVDGTITRSDVLGHLLPMIGKDWSHKGINELYTNIEKRGYRFLYLTARAISQSGTTKEYIKNLNQSKLFLD
jgi:phosphatidate phosphatase LPIN